MIGREIMNHSGDEILDEEEEYDELELLERLESLREDMEDLGVKAWKEVIQRINELHQKLDTREQEYRARSLAPCTCILNFRRRRDTPDEQDHLSANWGPSR